MRSEIDQSDSCGAKLSEKRLVLISKVIIAESERCLKKFGTGWVERAKIARAMGGESQLNNAIKELRYRRAVAPPCESSSFSIIEIDTDKIKKIVADYEQRTSISKS
jgi:hypothetical protein